jgi:copper chaperone CopZ
MLVISKVMGKKTLLFYLLSIVSGAIAFGLAIDYLLPREWFLTSLAHIHDCHAQGVSWFNLGCTLLMLLLLVNAFVLRYRKQDSCELPSGKNWVMMVKGMTCNHCKNNVEKAIMKVDGVEQVDINLADGRTVVTGSFDREAIKKSVEGIGFEVVEGD